MSARGDDAGFLHPLPRRHGTGIEAIARIAADRARGWDAVARALAPDAEAVVGWAATAGAGGAVEAFEAALGWRQGEEDAFALAFTSLDHWRVRLAPKLDADQRERIAAAARPAPALADLAGRLARTCEGESVAWSERDLTRARELRSAAVAPILDLADALEARGIAPAAPQPLRALDRLVLLHARAETGRPTTSLL